MYCIKCGNVLEETDRFCPKCGTRLSDASEVISNENTIVNISSGGTYKWFKWGSDIVEKIIYILLLFASSIVMIVLMYLPWLSHSYGEYSFTSTLSKLFNDVIEYPEMIEEYLNGDERTSIICTIILVVIFIITLIFIVLFLMKITQSLKKPKGIVTGWIAMILSIMLFIFTVVMVVVTNSSEAASLTTISISVAPYIFLLLSIVNMVIMVLLSTVDKRKIKRNLKRGIV